MIFNAYCYLTNDENQAKNTIAPFVALLFEIDSHLVLIMRWHPSR